MKTFLWIFAILFLLTACPGKDGSKDPVEPTPPIDVPDTNPPIDTQPEPPAEPTPLPPEGPGGVEPIPEPTEPSEPAPTPAPEPPTSEVPPDRADTFKVNITYGGTATYNTAARRAKYEKAIVLLKKVIADKQFRDLIKAHAYQGSDFAFMTSDPCKTDDCVYDRLLDGIEKLSPTSDNEMDMEVRFYYSSGNTVGYTYPNVKYIYVNVKYFDTYKLNSVAANMIHEYLHKQGYGHDSSATTRRPYSVPYGVGSIMRKVGEKYL